MRNPYTLRGFGALFVVALLLFEAAAAVAGSRSYTPRSSYVPRSSSGSFVPGASIGFQKTPEGVVPGAFGRSDPRIRRDRENRLQIERFQEQSRIRARQREILRKERGLVTDRRPASPSNRLTKRLRPQVEPLGNIQNRPVNQADRQLFLQSPPTNNRGEPREPVLPNRLDIAPFAHIDRNTR